MILSVVGFSLFVGPVQAASVTDIAAKSFGRISEEFVAHVKWPLASSTQVDAVVFGNKHYGFFRTKSFTRLDNAIAVEFVPAGYEHPLQFFAEGKAGEKQWLGSRQFTSPVDAAFSHLAVKPLLGEISTPFLALAGALPFVNLDFSPPEDLSNAAFVYIVNRLGEVVWIHVPDEGRTVIHRSLELSSAGGKGLALYAAREGIFETVSFAGAVDRRIDASKLLPIGKWRRGFVFDDDRGLLVAGEADFFERQWPKFWLPPVEGETAIIQSIDVQRARLGTVWNTLNYVWPTQGEKRRKEKIVSLDKTTDDSIFATLMPSGRILKIDETMNGVKKNWLPRVLTGTAKEEVEIELLHAMQTKLGIVAFYSDGAVWKCAADCSGTEGFQPWIKLPSGMPLSRGRVIWQRGETIAFYGVQAPFHSFRRRTVRPDIYWEWDLKSQTLKTEWEIPQLYYSPAVGAVGLMHLGLAESHGQRTH